MGGDDGDTSLSSSSSNFNKASPVNEGMKSTNFEDPEKNIEEQCEFSDKAENSNELPFDSVEKEESVVLMDKFETQAVGDIVSEGGIGVTEGVGGEAVAGEAAGVETGGVEEETVVAVEAAVVVETGMEEEAVAVGERLLAERSGIELVPKDDALVVRSPGEDIDCEINGEPGVVVEEKPVAEMEMPLDDEGNSVSCGDDHLLDAGGEMAVVPEGATTVTVEDTVGQEEILPIVGGGEKNAPDVGTSQLATAESCEAEIDVTVVADGVGSGSPLALAEEDELVTDEGVGKEVEVTEESSGVVKGTGEAESAVGDLEKSACKLDDARSEGVEPVEEGNDLMAEELSPETKMDTETAVEVANVTEGEHCNTGTEEKDNRSPEEESPSDNPKMVDEVVLESSGMQLDVTEVAAENEVNREMLALEEIPTMNAKTEMETETDIETVGGSVGESVPKLDDSEVLPRDEDDEEMVAEEGTALADTEMETETDAGDSIKPGGKQKKGKNSKVPGNPKINSRARKTVGEDVCFICFDGGDLVLCDRRGCPKAYHPSCVNRDEAFFQAKGRWNCGWHLCSICEKNAYYMCYTCTFSLCKGCIKKDVILCVRGNRGFCHTCMKTVKQIENNDLSYKEGQINFDDKSSWEFLFKDYYTDLKSKLSLSSSEIAEAKNPWKGSGVLAGKEDSPETPVGASNDGGSGSENSTENPEASKPKRKKGKKRSRSVVKGKDSSASVGEGISTSTTPSNAEWASKELLEFVMHMKNGDKSVLSQFDVQALLLEYIKRNKLRDPRKKSQIICDSRFQNLFGKPRVGHFEMLKLLESHFLIKEDSHTDDVQGTVVDTEVNYLEANEIADTPTKEIKDKKRKIRKKGNSRGSHSDRYEYAAIDMHNINLIYLRRKLVEDLLEDVDEFQNRVVGTFVRIRISGNTQKQDYRLVQVVGTSKVAEPYKVGKRTVDMMLEILNLNKTEAVSIDTISNQDFTEEECKRLRQSIKCGLLSRMTVGDVLDKAMEVQAARVNDWLESETQRLSHLRDRASDMGRRKELRECVEKLEILKTREERLRRLEEVPQVHADPNMDPNHESDEDDSDTDDNKREVFVRPRSSGFSKRGRAPMSPGGDFSSRDSWNLGKTSGKNWELETNFSGKSLSSSVEDAIQSVEVVKENVRNQGIERQTSELDDFVKLSASSKAYKVGWSNHSGARSELPSAALMVNSSASISGKEVLSALGTVNSSASLSAKEAETAEKISETQKMWHYLDPSGKVQGPFSVVQLRKWNNTGYFPANLKIWRTSQKQDESILLTDALAGRFQKEVRTGAGSISVSGSLPGSHVLSSHSGNIAEISLQLQKAREGQLGERSNIDQNHGASNFHLGMSKGLMAPSIENAKLSSDKWTRNDSMNLPSPTPRRGNAAGSGEGVPLINATSHPGVIQSATLAFPEQGSLSSLPASAELLIRGSDISRAANAENIGIGSGVSLQISSLSTSGEPHAVEKHNHLLLDNSGIPVQPVNAQNSRIETHGWGGPPTQKVEPNPSPVSGQSQVYNNPWGTVTPVIQNPTSGFPDSAASTLPQPEFWRPPAQGNQPNMQPAGGPSLAWGAGPVENNPSTPAFGPENPNAGWSTMQGTPNLGWVGPVPGATNMNWGATVQAPGPGNPAWAMAPVNMGTTMQGPMPGNMNPGWVAPAVNPGVQGVGPPVGNSGWAAPVGNMGPAVVPAPGNGWTMPPGNPGVPPIQAPTSGNPNHGWGPAPGNQGWGNEQHQSGGNSQGGDSGFRGGRHWNGPPMYGNGGGSGGPFRRIYKRETLCPFNMNGRCRKGSACDYMHA